MKVFELDWQYKIDLGVLKKFNTLSMTLLNCLLHRSECIVPVEDVAKILTHLGVGFQFAGEACRTQVKVFVPCFLKVNLPDSLKEKTKTATTSLERTLSPEMVVKVEASGVFPHFLILKIYEKLSRHLDIHSNQA